MGIAVSVQCDCAFYIDCGPQGSMQRNIYTPVSTPVLWDIGQVPGARATGDTMSSHLSMLERSRLQTFDLPPDRFMHMLTPEQTGSVSVPVLYKKQSGNAGFLGGGSFGAVHLEYSDSECEYAPPVRAVKVIRKITAEESKVHWEQEIGNLITLSKVSILQQLVRSSEAGSVHTPGSFWTCLSKSLVGGKTKNPSTYQWNSSRPVTCRDVNYPLKTRVKSEQSLNRLS